jgi:hypothetical protein
MANEMTLRIGLTVRSGNLDYRSNPTSFKQDLDTIAGPTPGGFSVPVGGIAVPMTNLTAPGVILIQNLDDTNYVEWGIHDGALFHPVGVVRAGKASLFELSPNLGQEPSVPTGTASGTNTVVNTFWVRAHTAACEVTMDIFEQAALT